MSEMYGFQHRRRQDNSFDPNEMNTKAGDIVSQFDPFGEDEVKEEVEKQSANMLTFKDCTMLEKKTNIEINDELVND